MKTILSLVIAGGVLASCSKQQAPPSNPLQVGAVNVHSVGIASSESDRQTCESEIRSSGGNVLYSGENGLILSDKAAADLKLSACKVKFSSNDPISLPRNSPQVDKTDIATLLRLLPAEEIGARSFIEANPTHDGRGVIVGILDTGVELDHPMLKKTSTGDDKVIDFADTSGEGRVTLSDVTVAADGSFTVDNNTYQAKDLGTQTKFGVFKGSSLKYSEDVADVDTFADIGVITYLDGNGVRKARLDLNNDKNLTNDTEIGDYALTRAFVKLGEKKTLTTSLKISTDGALVSLCFDDGTHGTHVAGIAAGYEKDGLVGVAPGAKVVAVKIGDNRLSGGSTTTASMLLAIDYAAQKGVHVINLSYGIRSGSNLGASAIDQYVDKVSREKGILFSISAGNEGPGLLTTGVPAGANTAITNGAYVSKETARELYGHAGFDSNTVWYFSSVGPRMDGALKPTLLAPGSALSSVPPWSGALLTYRGTSMASPETTGGLALILSAAQQSQLPTDRVSVTQALYASAKPVEGLALVEQGHGLMSVPGTVDTLKKMKGSLVIDYDVATTSVTSPNSRGRGVYVRNRQLPANNFTVQVAPLFPSGTSEADKLVAKTFKLETSADWIKVPPTFYLTNTPRTFQLDLKPEVMNTPGLKSAKVTAIDEKTGRMVFIVPVTIVVPHTLNENNNYATEINETVKVGQTQRIFLDVPVGTTSVIVDLASDGPVVWGQLLDQEGRKVGELRDSDNSIPMSALRLQANIKRAGVYELDVVGPPQMKRAAKVRVNAKAISLSVTNLAVKTGDLYDLELTNAFDAIKVIPRVEIRSKSSTKTVSVAGTGTEVPFKVDATDMEKYSSIKFTVKTSKTIYDLMTDYPFRVFDKDKGIVAMGGLELDSDVDLPDLGKVLGDSVLEVSGAFTLSAPQAWSFQLTESRLLKEPVTISQGAKVLVERGQTIVLGVKFQEPCVSVALVSDAGKPVQDQTVCKP